MKLAFLVDELDSFILFIKIFIQLKILPTPFFYQHFHRFVVSNSPRGSARLRNVHWWIDLLFRRIWNDQQETGVPFTSWNLRFVCNSESLPYFIISPSHV